jgi:hypothetical protein
VSNSYNRLFQSKFRGCTQIGYVNRDDNKVHLRVFKLPDTESLVGIYDGIDCWVANPRFCLHGMKPGNDPNRPESHLTSTRKRVVIPELTTRRKVLIQPTIEPKPRRRIHVTN